MRKGKETQSERPNPDQSIHILIRLFLEDRGIKETCSISQCLRSSKYQNPDHSFSSASLFMLHLQISIGFTLRHCIFQQLLPGKAVLLLPAQPTGDVSSVKISSTSCCPPSAPSPWPGGSWRQAEHLALLFDVLSLFSLIPPQQQLEQTRTGI